MTFGCALSKGTEACRNTLLAAAYFSSARELNFSADLRPQLSMAAVFGFDVMFDRHGDHAGGSAAGGAVQSDLVLAPATGPFEARQVTKGIAKYCPDTPTSWVS